MECVTIGEHSFYRFVSDEVKTNMYVLMEKNHALIIDPHLSEEALRLLNKYAITNCTVLLTHEHSDHTCGIPELLKRFRLNVICHQKCAETLASIKNNQPAMTVAMLSIQDSRNGTNTVRSFLEKYEEFKYDADIAFESTYEFFWCGHKFIFTATPGHSKGGCCICWNDTAIFTGDSLMVSIPVITRFPGGSTKDYKTITVPFLRSLDSNLVALPGHGQIFRLGDALAGIA